MSTNLPDPGRIPDMSLGERDDKPMKAERPDAQYSHKPQPMNEVQPLNASADSLETPPADWQEGDRVLAPWEPMFLYAGTIKQIRIDDAKGDQALIEFDDGDEGWVFLFSLCPLLLKEEQRVFCRRRNDPHYHAAEIIEVSGEEVHVQFDRAGSEWTTVAALRIPCVENGPAAVGTKFGANRAADISLPSSSGVPSWVIWVSISILLAILRIGCRSMSH